MMDIYENMENQTKVFILEQLRDARSNPEDVNQIRPIAFGALLFSVNRLFPCFNQKLADWWNDEILPQFREIGTWTKPLSPIIIDTERKGNNNG